MHMGEYDMHMWEKLQDDPKNIREIRIFRI